MFRAVAFPIVFAGVLTASIAEAQPAKPSLDAAVAPLTDTNANKAVKPPAVKGIATDPEEAPAPQGTLARFGTSRFRGEWFHPQKISADGTKLITHSNKPGTWVWEATSAHLIAKIPHGFAYGEAEVTRDGKRIFILDGNRAMDHLHVKICQLPDGKLVQTISYRRSIGAFALAPDDRTMVLELVDYETKESKLELRDLARDKVIRRFATMNIFGRSSWIRFAPDGKSIFVIRSMDPNRGKSMVETFDVATGALKSRMEIDGVEFLGNTAMVVWNGKTLVAVGNTVWDLAKGQLHWQSKGQLGRIDGILPDGHTVLGASEDRKNVSPFPTVVWDMKTDQEVRRFEVHAGPGFVVAPDGKYCISTVSLSALHHWDPYTGKEVLPLNAPIECGRWFAFAPNRKYLATMDWCAGEVSLHLWDCTTGKRIMHVGKQYNRNLGLLRFSADSKTLLCGGNREILAIDTASGKQTKSPLAAGYGPDSGAVALCELGPDEKILAIANPPSAGSSAAVQLWDWKANRLLGTLDGGNKDTRQSGPMSFSSDGKFLACFAYPEWPDDAKSCLQVWSVADRKLLRSWEASPAQLSLRFVEDGEFLVGTYHHKVVIWNAGSGKEMYSIDHPGGYRLREDFDSYGMATDGQLVATASNKDDVIRFWDVRTGKRLGESQASNIGAIKGLALSDDGSLLVVSGADTTILLVDVRHIVDRK